MKYFVSYQTASFVGWHVLNLCKPIAEVEDIKDVCQLIKEVNNYAGDIVVLNWRRMEDPE